MAVVSRELSPPLSLVSGKDFQIQVGPYVGRKIALLSQEKERVNPVLIVEKAAYSLMERVLAGASLSGFQTFQDLDGTVLIVQKEFLHANHRFVEDLLAARQRSRTDNFAWDTTLRAAWFGPASSEYYHSFYGQHLPVLCLQIDDLSKTAVILGIDESILHQALQEASYWKASEHLVFASEKMPGHNYPAYVDESKGDLTRRDFLTTEARHERLHILIDQLTLRMFGVWHTWLNEGFANQYEDHKQLLKQFRSEVAHWPSLEEVFIADEPLYKYAAAPIVLDLIGHLLVSQHLDKTASYSSGAYKFLELLSTPTAHYGIEGLHQRTKEILGEDNYQQLSDWWTSLEKDGSQVPLKFI